MRKRQLATEKQHLANKKRFLANKKTALGEHKGPFLIRQAANFMANKASIPFKWHSIYANVTPHLRTQKH